MEKKQNFKKESSIMASNFNMEKETDYRRKVLQKVDCSTLEESTIAEENDDDEDVKIIQAPPPKDVLNLKRQYDVL